MSSESEFVEFKKTTAELNSAMESVSSMLNKHGMGKIYFGIKNDGTPYKFQITDSTLRDISRKVFESIKPQIYPEIKIEEYMGVDVIVLSFEGKEQPYSAFGKYYIRVADEDRELSPSELRKIMIGKEYEENWGSKPSELTIDDVDQITLDLFKEKAIECGRLPNVNYDNLTLLKKLNLITNNHLNNAGKMLFSKTGPIVLKMAVFATDQKITFLDIKREEGNIFQLIEKAMRYVIDNIRWRVEITGESIHRKEIPEVPISALREVIVNSFAHARYEYPIQHEIDIFSNRISISNPGSFANDYKPEDFAYNTLSSVLRNELIAKTLYLCKDVESFGTGLKKVYSICNEQNVVVDYTNEENFFVFNFYREDRNVVTNVVTNVVLTKNEKMVLSMLQDNPRLSALDISAMMGKTSRTIQRVLDSLKNKGLIKREGSNKNGFWKVLSK